VTLPPGRFEQGLKEAGFINGQNVAIDYRWGNDQSDRLAGLAADLIRRQVAVIIGNTLATHSIMATTKTIPVVFVVSSDPVRTGLVASLNPLLRRWSNKTPVGCTSQPVHISSANVYNSRHWRLATRYLRVVGTAASPMRAS
jgi:ABC-type uncharacterized transport system substrate-binding protein